MTFDVKEKLWMLKLSIIEEQKEMFGGYLGIQHAS
jgi:hypothetical protein